MIKRRERNKEENSGNKYFIERGEKREMREKRYKRRSEFTKEEWKEIIKKALRLRFEYGWGHVRIARELGISPNTVADWIYRKFPLDYVRDGIFEEDMRSTIRTLKEEREEIERLRAEGKISEEVAKRELEENEACMLEAMFLISLAPYFARIERRKKEGDDSYLIYG